MNALDLKPLLTLAWINFNRYFRKHKNCLNRMNKCIPKIKPIAF